MRSDGVATLALSDRPPEPVVDIQAEPPGFEGIVKGIIDCIKGDAFGSRTL